MLSSLAGDLPRGDLPRAFVGEQNYWTLVGVDGGGDRSGLLSEDGAIELGRGGFSVEPSVQLADGRRITWADVQHELDEMQSAASVVFQDGAVIHQNDKSNVAAQGVIFMDLRAALQAHPELVQKYFMTEVVKPDHNKFTALHAALWDSGAFIFVPKNTRVELPLQIILNQASEGVGSYHHTLLVAETQPITARKQWLAGHLVVSARTIHAHLRSIFSKLEVSTRTAPMIANGIISCGIRASL